MKISTDRELGLLAQLKFLPHRYEKLTGMSIFGRLTCIFLANNMKNSVNKLIFVIRCMWLLIWKSLSAARLLEKLDSPTTMPSISLGMFLY